MATPAAERWSDVIDEQEASGLSVREFARTRALNSNTLFWWRSRLGRARQRGQSRFVEVVASRDEAHGLALTLAEGRVHLTVDAGSDMALLRRVVLALC